MCALSINVPIWKKSGSLSYAPRISQIIFSFDPKIFETIVNIVVCKSQMSLKWSFYILTFDRPSSFVDFKNRMQLCRKINKKQRKCHVSGVSGKPEGRITTGVHGLPKYIYITTCFSIPEDRVVTSVRELRDKRSDCFGRWPSGKGCRQLWVES